MAANPIAIRPIQSGSSVAAIVPSSMAEIFEMAKVIARSGMAPKAYLLTGNTAAGYDENKITVGIMHGLELGLTPLAALQSIAVINGTPAVWGDGMLALIQGSGLLEDMSEAIEGESLGRTATCTMKRKGRATPIVAVFSMADAKKAGLMGKAGPWTSYTDRMLQMRARGFCARNGFSDVLKGMSMVEEVQDMGPATPLEAAPPRPTRETVAAAKAAEAAIDVEPEEDIAPIDDVVMDSLNGAPAEAAPDENDEWMARAFAMIDYIAAAATAKDVEVRLASKKLERLTEMETVAPHQHKAVMSFAAEHKAKLP